MDQMVKPTPAPISARVILPRVLLKNGPEPAVAGGCAPWLRRACAGARAARAAGADVASTWRLAGDSLVSCDPLIGAPSSAALGATAAPSATLTHRAITAVRLNNRLT